MSFKSFKNKPVLKPSAKKSSRFGYVSRCLARWFLVISRNGLAGASATVRHGRRRGRCCRVRACQQRRGAVPPRQAAPIAGNAPGIGVWLRLCRPCRRARKILGVSWHRQPLAVGIHRHKSSARRCSALPAFNRMDSDSIPRR